MKRNAIRSLTRRHSILAALPVRWWCAAHLVFIQRRELFSSQIRRLSASPLDESNQIAIVSRVQPVAKPTQVTIAKQRIGRETDAFQLTVAEQLVGRHSRNRVRTQVEIDEFRRGDFRHRGKSISLRVDGNQRVEVRRAGERFQLVRGDFQSLKFGETVEQFSEQSQLTILHRQIFERRREAAKRVRR